MFEADPNLWLQSFPGQWLLPLMLLVSELGTSGFYIAAVLLLAFGARLKPTLHMLLALVLAATATGAIKLGFALPRPSEVDARVLDKGEAGHALVPDGAADAFWGMPGHDAIATVRAAGEMDYGFISGHASAATAFAIGIVLFFGLRQRWVWGLAIGWALLMGVSRMYLGRHFLADVLGGWIIGGLAVWMAWCFLRATGSHDARTSRRAWIGASVAVVALFLLSIGAPFLRPGAAGEVAGILACLFVVERVGGFSEDGKLRRLGRVALALPLGYGIDAMLSTATDGMGWASSHPGMFLLPAISYPAAILGAFFIARGLRLYRPAEAA